MRQFLRVEPKLVKIHWRRSVLQYRNVLNVDDGIVCSNFVSRDDGEKVFAWDVKTIEWSISLLQDDAFTIRSFTRVKRIKNTNTNAHTPEYILAFFEFRFFFPFPFHFRIKKSSILFFLLRFGSFALDFYVLAFHLSVVLCILCFLLRVFLFIFVAVVFCSFFPFDTDWIFNAVGCNSWSSKLFSSFSFIRPFFIFFAWFFFAVDSTFFSCDFIYVSTSLVTRRRKKKLNRNRENHADKCFRCSCASIQRPSPFSFTFLCVRVCRRMTNKNEKKSGKKIPESSNRFHGGKRPTTHAERDDPMERSGRKQSKMQSCCHLFRSVASRSRKMGKKTPKGKKKPLFVYIIFNRQTKFLLFLALFAIEFTESGFSNLFFNGKMMPMSNQTREEKVNWSHACVTNDISSLLSILRTKFFWS